MTGIIKEITINQLIQAEQLIETLEEQEAEAYKAMTTDQKDYYNDNKDDKEFIEAVCTTFRMSDEIEFAYELMCLLKNDDEYAASSSEEFRTYYENLVDYLEEALFDAEACIQVQQCMSDADIQEELERENEMVGGV